MRNVNVSSGGMRAISYAIVSLLAFVFIIYERVSFLGLRVVCALGIFMLNASVFSRSPMRFRFFLFTWSVTNTSRRPVRRVFRDASFRI